MKIKSLLIILLFSFILIFEDNFAQFIDNFETELKVDSAGLNGWTYRTGDGNATMKFISSKKGYASIFVDATNDKRGIWWALIRSKS
jgi:hypothetical protein